MKTLPESRRAAALPFVLLLVALNVTVIVALLIYATTELQASRNSVQAEAARTMAQSGIDLAASLIAANSTNNGFVTYQRVTNVGGVPRLETRIANVVAPDPSKPWKRVATNPAVLHSGFAAGTGGVDLNFAVAGDTSAGFIAPRTNLGGWQNLSPDMFRMDWIYVYKGPTNDPKNLVGRFAYWVDDESSKLNVNYSGSTNAYETTSYKNNMTLRHYIKDDRPGTMPAYYKGSELSGRIWPLDMELGGIAGLSTTNAYQIIKWRGQPGTTGHTPYPSVLGLRIGTVGSGVPGGLAVTNLFDQSALAFTATAYSGEEERSYATGRRRYDMLYMQRMSGASPNPDAISLFQSAILADHPEFAAKYNLPGLAWNAYSLVQIPGSTNPAKAPHHPAEIYGSSPQYVRGLPLLNEISLLARVRDEGTRRVVELETDAELAILSQFEKNDGIYRWSETLADKDKFEVVLEMPPATAIFGHPIENVKLVGTTHATAASWLKTYAPGFYGPTNASLTNALAVLRSTNSFETSAAGAGTFPTNATIKVNFDGKTYQTIALSLAATNLPPPLPGQTNVYHMVARPRATDGYRGDPRFGVLDTEVVARTNEASSGLATDPGQAGPSFKPGDYASAPNHPDMIPPELAFDADKGLPNHSPSASSGSGFGPIFSGNGWIGEVPVTTASGDPLAFSTPRLWGDGRAMINGAEFPPDWLLLDSLHMGIFPADSAGTFASFGRVNVNSAKPFFQSVPGSLNRSDTIMDSVTVNARTRDFNSTSGANTIAYIRSDQAARTNVLSRIRSMTESRNSADNPYTTHFEFLADLAATNLPTNPTWWMAPDPATGGGDIYAATNTTDRRIEGIVRSLNQKLTTHGNQFSIFSLGQALQVTPSGQTNVVGESYLQSVYERAPAYDEATGAITNSPTGAPPMRQLYLRELRY